MRTWIAVAALVLFAGQAMASSLYERMHEREGLARIAARTIDNALADDRIKASFDDTNIGRLKGLLSDQFCVVAGGPCAYKGRNMAKAHASLHLHDMDFNALVEDLQNAMDDEGIPFGTQNEFLSLLAPMHRDVVNPDAPKASAAKAAK